MKKERIEDILLDLGSVMPPKINHSEKIIKIHTPKKAELIPATKPGELLVSHNFSEGLIRSLELNAWGAEFNFYDGFIEYALNYFDTDVTEGEYIPFFSFTPQYSHMTQRQLRYYLYWRYKFRNGVCIKADFSYIMLFIYEVLNIPEKLLPPKKGVRYLAHVWAMYRKQFPQLDKYLSEWMVDYCLVHFVECPGDIIKSFLTDILKKTSLPEFYLNKYDLKQAEIELIKTGSDYDFNNASCVTDENREIFMRHINMALKQCFSREEQGDPPLVSTLRDTYVGALCIYENKRRMTITHYKLDRAQINSVDATEAVKYAESLVKSGLGLRSKYIRTTLAPHIKDRIDDYFMDEITNFQKPTTRLQQVGDRRYEPESRGFSEEEAKRIELESRSTAEMLEGESIKEAGEELKKEKENSLKNSISKASLKEKPEKNTKKAKKEEPEPEVDDGTPRLKKEHIKVLDMIYTGNFSNLQIWARVKNFILEALIEEVNYYAFLTIGDIVLEKEGKEYKLIEEYREEVEKWLKK